jgi:RNA ligase
MTTTHHPFPSINQFRNVVQHVRRKAQFRGMDDTGSPILDHAAKAPTLTFEGTVKLHGTNAAVVFSPGGITFQSRERVLSETSDNMGFYAHMREHHPTLWLLFDTIVDVTGKIYGEQPTIAVYGEWCGGNIQKGVGISGLPKMFVVFAVKINDEWFNEALPTFMSQEASIYSIYQFQTWIRSIDFEQPEARQNMLGEITLTVENECPVAKYFGQSGVGEGVVWRCIEDPSSDLWFKVKGEKHSASKVKTLAAVDTEAVETIQAFVSQTVTEARLEQGLQNLLFEQRKPFAMTSMGDFIRWVHGDVVKEEADTLEASGIDVKKIGGPIAQAAKRWFVERLNQETFKKAA